MSADNGASNLHLISWNVTLRCPLRCPHCYMNAGEHETPEVLSTEEAYAVIDQICELGRPVVILSGGEPLMRDDIFAIARYGTDRGLKMAMGTSGVLIDENVAQALKESGIRRVAVSIDSAESSVHDRFRGLSGAWQRAVQGICHCMKEGIGVQINTTVLSPGIKALNDVITLGRSLGVKDYQLFFPVPTGRGNGVQWLTPEVYEGLIRDVLVQVQRLGSEYPAHLCTTVSSDRRYPGHQQSHMGAGLHSGYQLLPDFCGRRCYSLPVSAGTGRKRAGYSVKRYLESVPGLCRSSRSVTSHRKVREMWVPGCLWGMPGPFILNRSEHDRYVRGNCLARESKGGPVW